MKSRIDNKHLLDVVSHGIEFHELKGFLQPLHLLFGDTLNCPLHSLNLIGLSHVEHVLIILIGHSDNKGSPVQDILNEAVSFKLPQGLSDGRSAHTVFVAQLLLNYFLSRFKPAGENVPLEICQQAGGNGCVAHLIHFCKFKHFRFSINRIKQS